WAVLWAVFGVFGLPERLLSDNGFGPRGPSVGGLSWLEARLVRLNIVSVHGRPYQPQTQGKVERLHRTLDEEGWPLLDWQWPDAAVAGQVDRWREQVYNAVRPHEALGDVPPATRWYPSERQRPARLPALVYPAGVETRKVMQRGEVSWRGFELMGGRGC